MPGQTVARHRRGVVPRHVDIRVMVSTMDVGAVSRPDCGESDRYRGDLHSGRAALYGYLLARTPRLLLLSPNGPALVRVGYRFSYRVLRAKVDEPSSISAAWRTAHSGIDGGSAQPALARGIRTDRSRGQLLMKSPPRFAITAWNGHDLPRLRAAAGRRSSNCTVFAGGQSTPARPGDTACVLAFTAALLRRPDGDLPVSGSRTFAP